MTKTEARAYAQRIICGYVEESFHGQRHPLVYDEFFNESTRGRRLSPEDNVRVEDAMEAIIDKLYTASRPEEKDILTGKFKFPKASGKPGSLWKKYGEWLKAQGRR